MLEEQNSTLRGVQSITLALSKSDHQMILVFKAGYSSRVPSCMLDCFELVVVTEIYNTHASACDDNEKPFRNGHVEYRLAICKRFCIFTKLPNRWESRLCAICSKIRKVENREFVLIVKVCVFAVARKPSVFIRFSAPGHPCTTKRQRERQYRCDF